MMSILRTLAATGSQQPCTFIHGARSESDTIFARECGELGQRMETLDYRVHLTQPSDACKAEQGASIRSGDRRRRQPG